MKKFTLKYAVNGQPRTINYSIEPDGSFKFQFIEADGSVRNEVYRRNQRGGPRDDRRPPQDGPGGPDDRRPPRPREDGNPPPRPSESPATSGSSANSTVSDNRKPIPGFVLRSSVVADGAALPVEFTGDGAGESPPLEWTGAPAGTKSFAIIMHHIPGPGGPPKWYWTIWNIPATATALPRNSKAIGNLGNNSIGRNLGYAPPHSKGPGLKLYTITLYALSDAPQISVQPSEVNREVLLAAIKDRILGTTELRVTYTKPK